MLEEDMECMDDSDLGMYLDLADVVDEVEDGIGEKLNHSRPVCLTPYPPILNLRQNLPITSEVLLALNLRDDFLLEVYGGPYFVSKQSSLRSRLEGLDG